MPLIPQPANRSIGIIDYPPAAAARAVIAQSTFPADGGVTAPSPGLRYTELLFDTPGADQLWLIDSVQIASTSASLPICYVGVISAAAASMFVPSSLPPYGDVDHLAVIDSTPNGWADTAGLGGVAVRDTQRLSVLWVGVTECFGAAPGNGPDVVAAVWARVHYRLAAVI